MKNLLIKEIKLAMHPTALIFLALSAMLIIPNYPYYVTFFYTGLAVFFTCLGGRENNDVFYTLSLPVRKKDIVASRIAFTVILELVQMIMAIPFALLRQSFDNLPGNQVGMDANIALFGMSFIMLGIFNFIFYDLYYRDVTKVGKAFAIASTFEFIYMGIAEALTHIVPFFRDKLDTPDTQFITEKVIVLLVGAAVYAILTGLACKLSIKHFDKLDL